MRNKIVIALIIFLALFLRLHNLTGVPTSPDWDEAALGYNAFTILQTGKDEYGNFLPLSLRSFNDYKPAFYAYLTVPSVAVFGLNLFAVRFPSVILGVLTVLGVYFFAQEIFKRMVNKKLTTYYSLLTAFFLAISPWHIQFSRAAFEVNSSLFLIIWGMTFLLMGLNKRWLLPVSAIFLSLSLYAYHSARIFIPLMLGVLFFLFRKELLKEKKIFLASLILGVVIALPAVLILISPEGRQRLSGVSIYSDQTGLLAESVRKLEFDRNSQDPLANLWHNRRIVYVSRFIEGYLWHYTPQWLFLSGDAVERHHAPDMGMLYLAELPLVLAGMYLWLRQKDKIKWFIIVWFLVAALPGAPTNQVPHGVRSYYFLPTFQIFTALGFYTLWQKLRPNLIGKVVLISFLLFFIFNFLYYFQMYHFHLNKELGKFWQYGYEEAVKDALGFSSRYEKVVFSNKLEQPYIFFLFYTKYDPQKYLTNGGSNNIDYHDWSHQFIDNYEFKLLNWSTEEKNSRILYIGGPKDFPDNVNPIKTIYYPNGEKAFLFVEGRD